MTTRSRCLRRSARAGQRRGCRRPVPDPGPGSPRRSIQKYGQSTCEQLWEQRGKPKSAQEQEVIKMLRGDAQMRTVFVNKIAAPVANKMFECGMIP